jgi:RNA polymerase sigma-70 factor, ECF subfamily
VQETFIKAYWGLRRFRGDSAFYSWLHRIAVNSAKTALSLRARHSRVFSATGNADQLSDSGGVLKETDTPEELALTDEICAAVNAAIEALGDEQRTAIALREFEGFTYSQVACAMACPVGTVRSRVFRARETIDNQLRHVFDDGLGRARNKRSAQSLQIHEGVAGWVA